MDSFLQISFMVSVLVFGNDLLVELYLCCIFGSDSLVDSIFDANSGEGGPLVHSKRVGRVGHLGMVVWKALQPHTRQIKAILVSRPMVVIEVETFIAGTREFA